MVGQGQRLDPPAARAYFRSEIAGIEHLPTDEPSMVVGNHDGGYVFPDAICLGSFYYDERGTAGRRLYAMMHDFPFRIAPTLTEWLQRCGVLPASRRNSEKVLEAGHHILVYPGGSYEAFRTLPRPPRNHASATAPASSARRCSTASPSRPWSASAPTRPSSSSPAATSSPRNSASRASASTSCPSGSASPSASAGARSRISPCPPRSSSRSCEPIRLWKDLHNPDPDDKHVLRQGLALVRGRMQSVADRLYSERDIPFSANGYVAGSLGRQ